MTKLDISQALYFSDPYCSNFNAAVVQTLPAADGHYLVYLDKTYFYPTGGGQENDTGTIGSTQVIDVLRDEHSFRVAHVVESDIPIGQASCSINWERRHRNMQHHTGQHLLSQCALTLLGFSTVSANINGYHPSTIDLATDRLLTSSEIYEIEHLANQTIYENRKVNTYFVEPENINSIPLRRVPKVSEDIRVVEIEGFDYSACGGTHCNHTGEIGSITIVKAERVNNKTRLHFIAGYQALECLRNYHMLISQLSSILNTNSAELKSSVDQLIAANDDIKQQLKLFRQKCAALEAKLLVRDSDTVNGRILVSISDNIRSISELRELASELKNYPTSVSLITSILDDRLSILIACGGKTEISAREILLHLLNRINGRGGGDSQLAQGGGTLPMAIQKTTLDEFAKSIKDILLVK